RRFRLLPVVAGEDVERIGIAALPGVAHVAARITGTLGVGLGAKTPARPSVGFGGMAQVLLHLLARHAGEEVEGRVVVADVLEAEIVILADRPVALGRAIDAGLVAALPGAGRGFAPRLLVVARPNPNAVKELGIELHQS